jgi:hypothetical protein
LSTSRSDPGAAVPAPEADAVLQRALAEAVAAFGTRVREHGEITPFPTDLEVSQTDVAITVAAMLRAAEVSSFEIAAMFNI